MKKMELTAQRQGNVFLKQVQLTAMPQAHVFPKQALPHELLQLR